MSSSNGSMIAMVILLVLFIVGSGYLLIYNVLYISISKDTRFYGLMKTIGTTQKQIKSLVKKQTFKFACIGIPVGVVLAAAVSFALVPLFLQQGYEQGERYADLHPLRQLHSALPDEARADVYVHVRPEGRYQEDGRIPRHGLL